jgi:hypothetical protein
MIMRLKEGYGHTERSREPNNQSRHRRGPRGQQEFFEQNAHNPTIGGEREGPYDH